MGWQRFKHAFVACRGPEVGREYRPPRGGGQIEARGPEAQRLVEEAVYGVTLIHHRCSTCGRGFTNRELGNWRDEQEGQEGG